MKVMKTRNDTYQQDSVSSIHYEFKIRKSEEFRKSDSQEALTKHPEKVPVVVEEVCEKSSLPPLAHRKLLLPRQLTAGQLTHMLRSRLGVAPSTTLLVMIGERAANAGDFIGHLYDRLHDADGFLYVAYSPTSSLSGPKCFMRAPPSPPPPPTTPTSSEEPEGGSRHRRASLRQRGGRSRTKISEGNKGRSKKSAPRSDGPP